MTMPNAETTIKGSFDLLKMANVVSTGDIVIVNVLADDVQVIIKKTQSPLRLAARLLEARGPDNLVYEGTIHLGVVASWLLYGDSSHMPPMEAMNMASTVVEYFNRHFEQGIIHNNYYPLKISSREWLLDLASVAKSQWTSNTNHIRLYSERVNSPLMMKWSSEFEVLVLVDGGSEWTSTNEHINQAALLLWYIAIGAINKVEHIPEKDALVIGIPGERSFTISKPTLEEPVEVPKKEVTPEPEPDPTPEEPIEVAEFPPITDIPLPPRRRGRPKKNEN